ncbi:YeaH/YhbH family protein [Lichenihabitans psoromatis]|uniref:YeaH/YhbH family protein n=1 Tax=Lichenihabitans psoromatis TaxID=2528642 RepID=UPI0010360A5F|nr:YeaH/YhbH family protein [Lichenihabitans psoromatis]
MHIVDRRLNPGGKSFANRQRFLRRAKEQVQRAVRDSAKTRDIKDLEQGGEVTIPVDGISEPNLRRQSSGGKRDHILPGNKIYNEGDRLERPQSRKGGGSGAGDGGGGDDKFRFVLSREEFLNIFLDDLELPDLAKRRLSVTETQGMRRAGYTVSGSPANIALNRTMRNAMARRIALKRPTSAELDRLEAEVASLEDLGAASADARREALTTLRQRQGRTPYLDPIDLRYRRFEPYPKPIAQAVMFCMMDVSGSMTEHMKDLAKRFFMLMHVFLTRRYKHVDIVFIRHTDKAAEVDEETFFTSAETGGTLVSSALVEMKRVIAERYSPADWNIYGAQASDGDNSSSDGERTKLTLQQELLPHCQYFAYLEVGEESGTRFGPSAQGTTLWRTYKTVQSSGRFAMRRVHQRGDIYPVFRELFQKNQDATASQAVP